MRKSNLPLLPSPAAHWIWDGSDRFGYHYYLQARRVFSAHDPQAAWLLITADAFYQAWLNGRCVGHGPAKSAEGRRSVDRHDLLPFLKRGENVLEVLVLSVGVGMMTYCPGEAGLLFELRLDGTTIGSDAKVQVRRSPAHRRPTVRRWVLPGLEDVDAGATGGPWRAAKIVAKTTVLYPRRVPLPRREEVYPVRVVRVDQVRLPNFGVSFRIKPALVDAAEVRRWNIYATPATVRVPIFSPKAQTLRFTPTLGHLDWSFGGKTLFEGSGWALRPSSGVAIRLKRGRNVLEGRHGRSNHFEYVSLAGFTDVRVRVGPMEIVRDDGQVARIEPLEFANAHDLAVGAEIAPGAPVRRTILDLGCVHHGWISFRARGRAGSRLVLAFFEAIDNGVPPRLQWADGCNNALTYRLDGGWREFESFFAYGVRYLAVHEIDGAVELEDLRVLKATCTRPGAGDFRTSDPALDAIHRIAAQTIESGTDDTFTDCPTFEQVNWNFDNRLANLVDFLTGPNLEIARNSILLFAEDPEHRGLVASQTPSTWSLRIPLWSFHWIFWCWDYYWHTGDLAFVRKVFPRIRAGLDEALARVGSRGLMEIGDVWHFVEWGHGRDDDHRVNSAEQGALLEAMRVADKLAAALGQRARFGPARAKLRRAIHRLLWIPSRRCYADSLHEDGKPSTVSSQATNALLACFGAADEGWSRRLANELARGPSKLLPCGSPLGVYYLAELLDRYGHGDTILKTVRERWGDMVAAGDGTTWEVFAEFGHGDWPTRSRCHPFSAYVVKYFVKYVLGVEALAPGFAAVRVRPRPPRDLDRAAGTVPTPHGPLRISWKRQGGKIDLNIDAPAGIRVVRS